MDNQTVLVTFDFHCMDMVKKSKAYVALLFPVSTNTAVANSIWNLSIAFPLRL